LAAPAVASVSDIVSRPQAKMLVAARVLGARRAHERLFTDGAYQPLHVIGPRATNVVAFARSVGDSHAVVIAPRLVGDLLHKPVANRWRETVVELPVDIAREPLSCAITGSVAVVRDNRLELAESTPEMAFGLFLASHQQRLAPSVS